MDKKIELWNNKRFCKSGYGNKKKQFCKTCDVECRGDLCRDCYLRVSKKSHRGRYNYWCPHGCGKKVHYFRDALYCAKCGNKWRTKKDLEKN